MAGIFPAYLFVINRVYTHLGSACVKLMSSVDESRGQIGGALRS